MYEKSPETSDLKDVFLFQNWIMITSWFKMKIHKSTAIKNGRIIFVDETFNSCFDGSLKKGGIGGIYSSNWQE